MKKFLSVLLALAMIFSLTVTVSADETKGEMDGYVVVLHTNDVHGAISGYAKVAALKKAYEAEGAYVLLMDAGDFCQGDPTVSVSQGKTAVELMNMAGYDVTTLGNHEFDYGYDNLVNLSKEAKFPIVAANVLYQGKVAFNSNQIFTTPSGVKIGVFGLETPETATKAHPAKIKGVTILGDKSMFDCAQAQVDSLKADGCDYIICLGHLGIDKESIGNRSTDLLNVVDGIDVFIDGHSHSTMKDIAEVTDKDGKVSKKQLLDADGNPVTAETEFVPDDTYGTVDVTFTFDGSLLKDNTPVVAFESLSYKDKEIASHSDIEDEDQTVTMHTSEIGTTAMDKLDGDKTVIADAESTVTDKVEYDHVLTGKAYTMAGILMDAKTGLPVLTGEGAKKYTEDDLIKFTSGLMNVLGFQSNTYSIKVKDKDWGNGAAIVKNADGSYTYDASERTENEDGTWTVKTDTQTLTEQEDGTWKLTGLEGSGSATADGGTSYVRNIEETYKADEVEVTDNGIDWSNAKKLPTASIDLAKVKAYAEENKDLLSCLVYKTAEFTPEKESGSIDMDYTFNSNDVIDRLSGETKNLVVFEVMFKGSIENASDETPVSIVASECDKDNEGQTVKLASSTIGTTATDKSDGDHELMAGKDAVITDEVKYEDLIPGKEYTLHATLMDKKTGEPLKVADKGVTAELKFTPNSESGTVSIDLGEFDATSLDGHTLVVFEELTKQSDIDGKTTDVTVAEHKDINDEGQSVTVTSTPAGSTYGKTGVDMTNIAIAIGILLIAAGCATAYGIKSRKTTKGDADESAEDNTEA